MPTRQRKLRKAARIAGKSYAMSSYTESAALEAAVENAGGGGGAATGYPQVVSKLPVYITDSGTIEHGDAIYAMGGSYTFSPGTDLYDQWTASYGDNIGKSFNDEYFSGIYTAQHGGVFDGLAVGAEALQLVGIYNGPTIQSPVTDPAAWEAAGGNVADKIILLDVIMSGEAEFVPVNLYNINIGAPIQVPDLLISSTHPSCGKMDTTARPNTPGVLLPGAYVSSVDSDNGVYKLQLAPGAATYNGNPNTELSAQFITDVGAQNTWPAGWTVDPF